MIIERWPDGERRPEPKITIEEVTDPAEIAHSRAVEEAYRRNEDWLDAHRQEVLPRARGKILAVAGQEAFIAATIEEALAQAEAAHPDDPGVVCRYIFPEAGLRIYAVHR